MPPNFTKNYMKFRAVSRKTRLFRLDRITRFGRLYLGLINENFGATITHAHDAKMAKNCQ